MRAVLSGLYMSYIHLHMHICTYAHCAPSHGGVLYSFWYWWNVVWIFYEFFKCWKQFFFKNFVLQNFMFSSRCMLFPTFKKNVGVKQNSGGGVSNFFLEKHFLLFHFVFYAMLFSTLKTNWNIEKFPFTYWLNGRWFLQIVDRDRENLYPI